MANFAFNIAKGRAVEFYHRVKNADPASCAFVFVALATSGLESDAVLKDKDTLAAVVAGTTNEVTNTNYARKTLVAADISSPAPDDTNDWFSFDLPDLLYSPGPSAGDGWSKIVLCYDPDTGAGTDSDIIPIAAYDVTITPDGNALSIVINTSGAYQAV